LQLHFYFPRPASHYRKDGVHLRGSAPLEMFVRPDLDKLIRAIGDALMDAGVLRDDSQLAGIDAEKEYAEPGTAPGAQIVVLFS
jgi:Holliday junction resolvase RusA-like endonuclease